MTGETHRLCGKMVASASFIGLNVGPVIDLYKSGFEAQSLLETKAWHITETWPVIATALISLLTLRMFARMTSVLNDLDQQPKAIPYKGNWLARMLNKLLQKTGQHHRSHATHTVFTQIAISVLLAYTSIKFFGNNSVVTIAAFGFICGTASHIFADMFNGVGVYLLPIYKKKVAFVPRKVNHVLLKAISSLLISISIGCYAVPMIIIPTYILIIVLLIGLFLFYFGIKYKNMVFNTGNQWEEIFFKLIGLLDRFLTALACLICFI